MGKPVKGLFGLSQPIVPNEFVKLNFSEFNQVVGIKMGVVQGIFAEWSLPPIVSLKLFVKCDVEVFLHQRGQPVPGPAQYTGSQHGVKQIGKGKAVIPLEG